mmetsp:Transcript_21377/g.62342  ORF Transcript_21377/g.62342 Transcript_21377/m.62342 type:complete len:156 (+) Transcript_21377:3643-4110(+)
MGYIESAPLFFMKTKTVADLVNTSWEQCDAAAPHLLEQEAACPNPPQEIYPRSASEPLLSTCTNCPRTYDNKQRHMWMSTLMILLPSSKARVKSGKKKRGISSTPSTAYFGRTIMTTPSGKNQTVSKTCAAAMPTGQRKRKCLDRFLTQSNTRLP